MINANELRIGNWIMIGHFDAPVKVIELHTKMLTCSLMSCWEYDSGLVTPIPLTSSILEKCGFGTDDNGAELDHPDYHKWYQKDFPVVGMIFQSEDGTYLFDENTDTLRIKHLHQLQNLYYALTGTELNYTP